MNTRKILDGRPTFWTADGVRAAAIDDESRQVICNSFPTPDGRVGYDFNCSACYLGHSHTEGYHAQSRAEYLEASRIPGQ